MLLLDPRSTARRRAGEDANPSAGGSTRARTQTRSKALPKIPKRPKIKTGRRPCPHIGGPGTASPSLPAVARQREPGGNPANPEIQETSQKWASDAGAIRPAPMARMAEIGTGTRLPSRARPRELGAFNRPSRLRESGALNPMRCLRLVEARPRGPRCADVQSGRAGPLSPRPA